MRIARKYYYIRASVATKNSTRKKLYIYETIDVWLTMDGIEDEGKATVRKN